MLTLQRRDQIVVVASLIALILLAWAYLIYLNTNMLGMHAGLRPWQPIDFIMMFLMWAIMMVGMMVPSAMRAVLIYAAIAARGPHRESVVAPVYLFVGGYIFSWTVFSLVATGLQWGLERAALLSPMMVSTSAGLGAGLLIAAGVYQLSPLKDVCLQHCQSPVTYLANNYRKGQTQAFLLGVKHGGYCLGCCWVLMGLLFVGGVMNLLWILAISLFVCAEKLLPASIHTTRLSAAVMILSGLTLFAAQAKTW